MRRRIRRGGFGKVDGQLTDKFASILTVRFAVLKNVAYFVRMTNSLVQISQSALLKADGIPALLDGIRPHWQAKNLIDRVRKLVAVDPSSACQRVFNAAMHDLREKVILAGLDIAAEAATQHQLPPVAREEDIENYSTSRLIDLAYRMGLYGRPDWRRISRCYEIRRDLEHEDDEYEAGIEDVVYIFNTCIDVVLSRDPIQVVRISEFKDLVEKAEPTVPDAVLLEDFKSAPQPRQEQIGKFLLSTALDKTKPDLVQQNAFTALGYVSDAFHSQVKTSLGSHLQEKVGRQLSDRQARVAQVSGLMPYIRQAARVAFFDDVLVQLKKIGYNWSAYAQHGDILRAFKEYGGLAACPPEQKRKILWWLVMTYIGSPGGLTQYGNVRKVYYSNSASPIIREMIETEGSSLLPLLESLRKEKQVKSALANPDVARRFEQLVDSIDNL
jgi:hypothetical protein